MAIVFCDCPIVGSLMMRDVLVAVRSSNRLSQPPLATVCPSTVTCPPGSSSPEWYVISPKISAMNSVDSPSEVANASSLRRSSSLNRGSIPSVDPTLAAVLPPRPKLLPARMFVTFSIWLRKNASPNAEMNSAGLNNRVVIDRWTMPRRNNDESRSDSRYCAPFFA